MTEKTTGRRISKDSCLMVCDLLEQYGVRNVVLSPGSRNAPIIVAVERSGAFRTRIVIDERSAAFAALGMALASDEPVAVVCTSGTALLNYAPAVAEAYYRRIPLIVVSADRPAEWIDQDDSQTIRQPGALNNIVRATLDVSESIYAGKDGPWWLNRRLNDVLSTAICGPVKGPVHINLQLGEPLVDLIPEDTPRVKGQRIDTIYAYGGSVPTKVARDFAEAGKVLIVVGFTQPATELSVLLDDLARSGCVVLKEAQSNVHCMSENVLGCVDATLRGTRRRLEADYVPELVVTMGGALLSRHVKSFLRRNARGARFWSVGYNDHAVDCFQGLQARIEMNPCDFLRAVAQLPSKRDGEFAKAWREAARCGSSEREAEAAPWSDLSGVHMLLDGAPAGWNLQASNGTAVRYVQLFESYEKFATVHCNRGVSGIDGCTSTAIGFAQTAAEPTLLLTGDMSAAYDIGALAMNDIPASFRMAVLNNGGGGIFRFIPTTRELPELEKAFVACPRLPLRALADGYGFRYMEAKSKDELAAVLPEFFRESTSPIILNILTPGEQSAATLLNYFK
ncbi:MAG: 2-succinyl-5-enolpyruvyl-6-hydroxy-3-cyclohexene-1-carboxylic-acid synthase [Muribaculaceae bacterium]|nr:2-succinyl-5-enolpyruvyl-6-hydroxy-3-cyclohexene-1-carboxylic-acid synthase [Muribaculaceae bacterium]